MPRPLSLTVMRTTPSVRAAPRTTSLRVCFSALCPRFTIACSSSGRFATAATSGSQSTAMVAPAARGRASAMDASNGPIATTSRLGDSASACARASTSSARVRRSSRAHACSMCVRKWSRLAGSSFAPACRTSIALEIAASGVWSSCAALVMNSRCARSRAACPVTSWNVMTTATTPPSSSTGDAEYSKRNSRPSSRTTRSRAFRVARPDVSAWTRGPSASVSSVPSSRNSRHGGLLTKSASSDAVRPVNSSARRFTVSTRPEESTMTMPCGSAWITDRSRAWSAETLCARSTIARNVMRSGRPALRARVTPLGDRSARADLLDDDEPLGRVEDVLDVRIHMTGEDSEAIAVAAERLVLVDRHQHRRDAGLIRTLAGERGVFRDELKRFGKALETFVDLAEERLVARSTHLALGLLLVHDTPLGCEANPGVSLSVPAKTGGTRSARTSGKPRHVQGSASSRRLCDSLRRCEQRGLVDRVAGETVELVGEQLARCPALLARLDVLAVERDPLDRLGGLVPELDVAPESRAEPPDEKRGLLNRAPNLEHARLERPALSDRPAPAERARPHDVGHRDTFEPPGQVGIARGRVLPLQRVDDETLDDGDEPLEHVRREGRAASPTDERGQVGEQQRHDDARRPGGRLAVEMELDHLRAHMPVELRKRVALDRDHGVERVAVGVGLGEKEDRARRMALGEACERLARGLAPLGRHPRHVRHDARAQVAGLAQLGELALDLRNGDVAAGPLGVRDGHGQRRRQDRPSCASISSAASGPHVPPA